MSEAAEQINESSKYSLSSAQQESMEEVESAVNILESLKTDTSHTYNVHHSLGQIQMKSANTVHQQTC